MPRSMAAVPSGRAAERGKRREIDVLEAAFDRFETRRGIIGEDVDDRVAGDEASRDDLVLGLIVFKLRAADDLLPDLAAGGGDQIGGLAFELYAAVGEHRHARAE